MFSDSKRSDLMKQLLGQIDDIASLSNKAFSEIDLPNLYVIMNTDVLNINSLAQININDETARSKLNKHLTSLIVVVHKISAISVLQAWRTRTTKDSHSASRRKGDAARLFIEDTISDRVVAHNIVDLKEVVHKQVAGWVQDRIKSGNVENKAEWPESMSDATIRRHFDVIRPTLLAKQLFGKEFFEEFPAKEILMRAAMENSTPLNEKSLADLDHQFSNLKTALAAS